MQEWTVSELRARLAAGQPVVIVDVRSDQEFAAGHIAGAIHRALAVLEADPKELPAGERFVTVCGTGGGRSLAAAMLLEASGVQDVAVLAGGTKGWAADGGALDRT